jgi:hypothetical protein
MIFGCTSFWNAFSELGSLEIGKKVYRLSIEL